MQLNYSVVRSLKLFVLSDKYVAIKILEDIADNIEEIDEEYLVLRDLCLHPNIPQFYGMFFRPGRKRDDDQLWFVMEVSMSTISSTGAGSVRARFCRRRFSIMTVDVIPVDYADVSD